MANQVFGDVWMQVLVTESAKREVTPGLNGIVGIGVGKKPQAVLEVIDGRVSGISLEEPEALIPFTRVQVEAWLDGELNLTEAYTKGDLKASGKTGHLVSALYVLDDREIIDGLPRD